VAAEQLGIPVAQPSKIRTPEFLAWVREQNADFALVMAYGRILPRTVLDAPRRGCVNLHASILPRWRGAAPITWAVVRGDRSTGISLMQMDEGMDTGPVFAVETTPIGDDESAGQLAERLAELAAKMVRESLLAALTGELVAQAQDEATASSAPPLSKQDGRIDWARSSQEVHDHVRGMSPWPGAFTRIGDKTIKILASRRARYSAAGAPPGTVVVADADAVLVACAGGALEIVTAQLEGKKAHSARELVSGRTIAVNMRLQ
jgi:methionyl-tRNA formyltransferase